MLPKRDWAFANCDVCCPLYVTLHIDRVFRRDRYQNAYCTLHSTPSLHFGCWPEFRGMSLPIRYPPTCITLEYLYWRVMSWAVPKKSGHVVHGAILFPRLLMHSRQNDGILCIWMQKIGLKRDLRCINPCKSGDGSYLKKLTSPPKGGGRNGNFRGSKNQKSGKCHELSRKSIKFVFTHPTRGGGQNFKSPVNFMNCRENR